MGLYHINILLEKFWISINKNALHVHSTSYSTEIPQIIIYCTVTIVF